MSLFVQMSLFIRDLDILMLILVIGERGLRLNIFLTTKHYNTEISHKLIINLSVPLFIATIKQAYHQTKRT